MNAVKRIPDSEGIELTRTAGSKAKLLERGANLRERIFGRALAREVERDVTPVRPRIIQDSGFADGMNKMNSG